MTLWADLLSTVFERDDNEVFVDPEIGRQAMVPLNRMLDFARNLKRQVIGNA